MKNVKCKLMSCAAVLIVVAGVSPAAHAAVATVRAGTAANAAGIQSVIDQFRADLGVNNGLGPCAGACVPGVGRREINWDAVPDAFSSGGANPFPGNFFNLPTGSAAGRIRGAVFTTTGTFEVSADADSDGDGNPGPIATRFGNHSPDNAADFGVFSAERIFGLVGTNVMSVRFDVPGQPGVAALTKGFGAIFTDVELADSTKLRFFDGNDQLLREESAPAFVTAEPDTFQSFSFVGVTFDAAEVARVEIVNGGYDLNLVQFGPDDAVAMDDFVYGEPSAAVPEPATLTLAGLAGLGALAAAIRRRAK